MGTSIEKAANKRRLYSNFVKQKDVPHSSRGRLKRNYDAADMSKIFGTAGKKEEKEASDVKLHPPPERTTVQP